MEIKNIYGDIYAVKYENLYGEHFSKENTDLVEFGKLVESKTRTLSRKFVGKPLKILASLILNHLIEEAIQKLYPDLTAMDKYWEYLTTRHGYEFPYDFTDGQTSYEVKRFDSKEWMNMEIDAIKLGLPSYNYHNAKYALYYCIREHCIYIYKIGDKTYLDHLYVTDKNIINHINDWYNIMNNLDC